MSGIINHNHFGNHKQKDELINALQQEVANLRSVLQSKQVTDMYVSRALSGACSNPNLKTSEEVAKHALNCADALFNLLNQRSDEQVEKEKGEGPLPVKEETIE